MRYPALSRFRRNLVLAALALAAASGCGHNPGPPPHPPAASPTRTLRPIEEVRSQLDGPDRDKRMQAAAALADYGKEAVPDLAAFAKKVNAGPDQNLDQMQEISSATGALEKIGPDAVPALIELLGEPGFLGNSAAAVLGTMGEAARPSTRR
ncbi:MAG TPA: hypothetical protein VMS17_01595 [Gemmataceae bacterium]|nr:hypothetical protein [Gemmataceae bacterium]